MLNLKHHLVINKIRLSDAIHFQCKIHQIMFLHMLYIAERTTISFYEIVHIRNILIFVL